MTQQFKLKKDLTGQVFGEWSVIGHTSVSSMILCRCSCGVVKEVMRSNVVQGISTNCGCKRIAAIRESATKHSASCNGKKLKSFRTWIKMMERCYKPYASGYKNYGGRGIKVCDRWKDYVNFVSDMGEPKDNESIERIDFNGDYEPNNCKWIARNEQNKNTSRTVFIEGMCMKDFCNARGFPYEGFQAQIRRGKTIEETINYYERKANA